MNVKSSITWIAVIAALALLWWPRDESTHQQLPSDGASGSPRSHENSTPRSRAARDLSVAIWKREVESLFARLESTRTTLLTVKNTEESDIYLWGVVPPAEEEIRALREQLGDLENRARRGEEAEREVELARLISDYDAFGEEGKRAILIDVPRDPGGRLSGFTCKANDFREITDRLHDGTMTELENLRGYAAAYAGMPLARFRALIAENLAH